MIKFDWVEIPEGEYITGMSDSQKAVIHDMIWKAYGINQLDPVVRQRVEKVTEWYCTGKRVESEFLREDEKRFIQEEGKYWYFEAENRLRRIPAQKRVWLPTFYIARFPITHEQADEFFESDAAKGLWRISPDGDDSRSPEDFMRDAAAAMIKWMGLQFPSDAEWEKAARGTDGRLYPWGDQWDPSCGNFGMRFHPPSSHPYSARTVVDAYPKGVSPYDVWDMDGNLCEYTTRGVQGISWKTIRYPDFFWALLAQGFAPQGDGHIGFRPVRRTLG